MQEQAPKLVLVRGLPGSGKSFICRALSENIGADLVVLLDPDAIDYNSEHYVKFSKRLSAEGVEERFHPYRYLRQKAYDGIRSNKIILWNQAFTNLEMFGKLVLSLKNFASENGKNLSVLVVEVEIDPSVARQRVIERVASGGHDVPEERFQKFIDEYFSFTDSGYSVVKVSGTSEVSQSIEIIKTELSKT